VCPHEAIDDEKLAAIFGTVFHDNSRVVVDVATEFRKRDVSSLFDEVAWDLSIATFCAFSDFPYRGKVEREYWLALSRDALSTANAGLAGSDGLAILHVHYLEKWPHQGQLKMISQINIRHTWNGIAGMELVIGGTVRVSTRGEHSTASGGKLTENRWWLMILDGIG